MVVFPWGGFHFVKADSDPSRLNPAMASFLDLDLQKLERHQLIEEKRKLEQSGFRVDWGSVPNEYLFPSAR